MYYYISCDNHGHIPTKEVVSLWAWLPRHREIPCVDQETMVKWPLRQAFPLSIAIEPTKTPEEKSKRFKRQNMIENPLKLTESKTIETSL